jgi:hypothetical protein
MKNRNPFAIRKMEAIETAGDTTISNRGFAIRNLVVLGGQSLASLSGLKATSPMRHD